MNRLLMNHLSFKKSLLIVAIVTLLTLVMPCHKGYSSTLLRDISGTYTPSITMLSIAGAINATTVGEVKVLLNEEEFAVNK